MRTVLSVDGGGTHSEFLAADERGGYIFRCQVGSVSFKSVGRKAALQNMRLGLQSMRDAGLDPAAVDVGVWGLSGCDTAADRACYEDMLVSCGLSLGRHIVLNDAELAFYASASVPGAVIVAGTGSIALGLDGAGDMLRCGGWNYAFSDLGSGYWMGTQVLRETALWLEDCRGPDSVFPAVCAQLGGDRITCLETMSALTDAEEIAAFARIVLETGDSPLCARIRETAADYLALFGSRVLAQLAAQGEGDLKIVLSGGLFANDGFYEEVASRFASIPVIRNVCSPAEGGLHLALSGLREQEEF